jgi:hypothetical protein
MLIVVVQRSKKEGETGAKTVRGRAFDGGKGSDLLAVVLHRRLRPLRPELSESVA